ncbi:MAG: hypothetical protein WBJ10_08205 [Daejeonella sp.]
MKLIKAASISGRGPNNYKREHADVGEELVDRQAEKLSHLVVSYVLPFP